MRARPPSAPLPALGLPHRRIEEWKYTDLRIALKRGAAAGRRRCDGGVGHRRSMPRSERWPSSMRTASCSSTAPIAPSCRQSTGVRGLEVAPARPGAAQGRRPVSLHATPVARTGSRHRSQHRLHDRRRRVARRQGCGRSTSRCCWYSPAPAARRVCVTTRNLVTVGSGARATLIEAHVACQARRTGRPMRSARSRSATARDVTHIKLTLDGNASSHLASWVAELGKPTPPIAPSS